MRLSIERKNVKVYPDPKRVIARYFFNSEERARQVILHVMEMNSGEVFDTISPILQEYSKRHRNITKVLYRHCSRLKSIFLELNINYEQMDSYRRLLIGSFFTHEYSIESAAFFNPSIVEDPDQKELEEGQKRVIISFRAVGEGHISSIVFRRALLDQDCNISVDPVGNHVDEAEIIHSAAYEKGLFFNNAFSGLIPQRVLKDVADRLEEHFDYNMLKQVINQIKSEQPDEHSRLEYDKVLWLADSYYKISFSLDTDISDRVIFPISEFERKGIEDARFVRFTEEDGSIVYFATYTAYDGEVIVPKMLKTKDFYNFKIMPLYGTGVQNKNFALFPRKINGKFVMACRNDGWNNYIMYSDNINMWENPVMIKSPKYPWEFVQVGNCGSPIETPHGWLLLTHGVGPMRRYCIGASLLQLDDPTIEISHLDEPLLIPNKDEREGYVPNVLYSCGPIVHNGKLVIPYGLSDYCSSFATVDLNALLDKLRNPSLAV
ncbi:glycoside hydrolase family 130 protein [Pontibacter sp. CAU 1760]